MAEKLLKYYKFVSDEKGFAGQIQLAQQTLMPSTKAALEPDSPENIDRFRKAVERITGKTAPTY